MADDDLPRILFEDDLAALLRESRRTIERRRRAGELPEPLPISGRPRWAREVVIAWLGGTPRGRRLRRAS